MKTAELTGPAQQALNALDQAADLIHHTYTGTRPAMDALTVAIDTAHDAAEALRADMEQPQTEPVAGDCPQCGGGGTVREMTTDRGPDDYEFDAECAACAGTGSASLVDAINALPYSLHRVRACVEVVSKAAVLAIVAARHRQPQPEPMAWWARADGAIRLTTCPPDDGPETSLDWRPLYAAPPQRAPLTDEQIDAAFSDSASRHRMSAHDFYKVFARAIERAHGIGADK